MNAIATNVLKTFTENFPAQPAMYFSPGRINLIGEHVDYNDGFVMPAAIDKGVYYAVAENGTDAIHFYSLDFDERFSIDIAAIKKASGWKNYVLSVVNEFLSSGKSIKGFDCVFGGDIPRGAGMSSSAAVEGGLAFALNDIFNCVFTPTELAQLCQRAEHNFPNVQCGIMDQFANMNGKKDQVLLLDCKSLSHEYLPLQLKGYTIVLLDTKVHHTLASGEYNKRRHQCEEGMKILKNGMGIGSFRDINKSEDLLAYKDMMGEEVYNRCLYVVEEIHRTQKAAEYLKQDNLIEFGKLMYATHEGLSNLYEVSCAELDFLVQQAKLNASVIGARMMGGGFGGCTINIVKEEGMNDLIEQSSIVYKKQFNIDLGYYVVETGDGTGKLNGNALSY